MLPFVSIWTLCQSVRKTTPWRALSHCGCGILQGMHAFVSCRAGFCGQVSGSLAKASDVLYMQDAWHMVHY